MVAGGKVITANLGDSRALMFNSDKIQELTKDHKPFEITEKMRIIKHGGKIYKEVEGTFNQIKLFHQFRILPGNLNVSRTIGDIEVKLRKYGGLPGMISSVPDICTFDKSNYDVLLLGSDGLFEAFSNE
jgi:serine/threonine protein phosphatase PrpC